MTTILSYLPLSKPVSLLHYGKLESLPIDTDEPMGVSFFSVVAGAVVVVSGFSRENPEVGATPELR